MTNDFSDDLKQFEKNATEYNKNIEKIDHIYISVLSIEEIIDDKTAQKLDEDLKRFSFNTKFDSLPTKENNETTKLKTELETKVTRLLSLADSIEAFKYPSPEVEELQEEVTILNKRYRQMRREKMAK